MIASIAFPGADKNAPSTFLRIALMDEGDGAESQALITDLVETCYVGADKCVIDVKPAELTDAVQVAWFAMEVNFKDFLSAGMAGVFAAPAGKAPAK